MKLGQGVFGAVTDDAEGTGKPRRERMRVLLAARLSTTFEDRPVRIRDLSSEGAMVEGDAVPSVGTDVILQRGPIEAFATVVWSEGRQCGLEFETTLGEDDFLTLLNPPAATGPAIEVPTGRPSVGSVPLTADDWAAARAWATPTGRGAFRD
jgi:hypothetical protein